MNIVLIGYRASGKTTVGRRLSALLGIPFRDTDEMIRQRTGKSVRQIVAEGGWPAFRDVEKTVVAGLSGLDGVVIALGGGAVTEKENVEAVKRKGLVIWLQADETSILERMGRETAGDEQRPPLRGGGMAEEVREMLAERTAVYRAHADLAVDTTGRSVEQIVVEIMSVIRARRIGIGV
ncbi:MAG TPA: shikimate kinase [Syntrophales bacterium]|nr:shikimate kinase [Syntrophales bacterium]HPI57106.1 shikimate kinase [Syntrophales bacterium]HPN24807.1 shikimate kinase [Syntrophales bacterium]HQM30094.1 shikimate kinase [Syntrophales bacterium]